MAFFGRLKKKPASDSVAAKPAAIDPSTVIITMPHKFAILDKPKFWTATKIWVAIVILIACLVGGVYWLASGIQSSRKTTTSTTTTSTQPSTTSNPALTTTTTTVTTPTQQTQTTTTSSPTTTTVPPSSQNPSSNVPPPSATPTVLPVSTDSDGDGLTDVEEISWGTDPNKADTDGDGYNDLQEIQNGYNPKGNGTLASSGLVSTYTSAKHHYSVVYPHTWTARATDDSEDTVMLTATPDEFVSINVVPNPNSLSLEEWYESINPTAKASTLTSTTIGTHAGLLSADHRTFYFLVPGQNNSASSVIVVSYNVGTKTETNFASTYEVIIRQLVVNPS